MVNGSDTFLSSDSRKLLISQERLNLIQVGLDS